MGYEESRNFVKVGVASFKETRPLKVLRRSEALTGKPLALSQKDCFDFGEFLKLVTRALYYLIRVLDEKY